MTVASAAQIVTFRLGEDLFAADINDVERVLRYAAPTPVPNVPDWVKGVIEYRSRVVPVIDLRERFELAASPVDGATRLMVLSADGEWVAAVVDAVLEVVPLGESRLANPPALFRGLAAEFLRGILRRNDRLIIVLDVARLLATHDRLSFDVGVLGGSESLGAISIGDSAADVTLDVGSPPVDDQSAIVPGPPDGDPKPTSGSPDGELPAALGGAASPDSGAFRLVGTSEDAPRPDESILRDLVSQGGPASPTAAGTGLPTEPSLTPVDAEPAGGPDKRAEETPAGDDEPTNPGDD